MKIQAVIEKEVLDPINVAVRRVAYTELKRFKKSYSKLRPKDGATKILGNDKPVLDLFRRLSVYDRTRNGFILKLIPVPVTRDNLDRIEKGYTTKVTHKMQRYLARKGLHVRLGTVLKVPGRKIFEKGNVIVEKNIEQDIVKHIEKELS